jgi:trigger factor
MRELDATLVDVDRAVEDGDTVTIDIEGTLDGEPQAGLTAEEYSYRVGSAAITPEVDEQLVGSKVGDTLEFPATHPDPDEDRQLQFRVVVNRVQEKVLPEVTDEWAAGASEFATVGELRSSLEDRMLRVRRAQASMNWRELVGEALAELVTDEVPEAMVNQEMQNRLQDLAMRLQAQGMRIEQYLAMTGTDPETFSQELRTTALSGVKVDLALRAVAEAEGLDCTDEDLTEELEGVASRVGETLETVRERFESVGQISAIRSDIRKRKALEWLLERTEVVDQDGATIDRSELEPPAADDDDDDPAADEPGDDTATDPVADGTEDE